jgi:hypothetical protein
MMDGGIGALSRRHWLALHRAAIGVQDNEQRGNRQKCERQAPASALRRAARRRVFASHQEILQQK